MRLIFVVLVSTTRDADRGVNATSGGDGMKARSFESGGRWVVPDDAGCR